MDTLVRLDAEHLRAAVVAFRDVLRTCQEVINRLNVYPVPDGDTGTNMAGTVEAVVAELQTAGPAMDEVCQAIAHGSLMGARGNSGIILCQILRGLTDVARRTDAIGPADLAAGLTLASEQAHGAVARPVDGTILSVARACAEAAEAVAGIEGATVVDVLDAAREAAVAALARTPEQLPVLAQAGVVDAGGAGFCLLLDAVLHVLDDRPLPDEPPVPAAALASVSAGRSVHDRLDDLAMAAHADKDVSVLRYEVMYLLEAGDAAVPAFRDVWAGIGDSIVVVGGDGMWNCHIHTDDIGAAIEAALDAGRPRKIRVTDLLEQVEEERWVREQSEANPEADEELPAVPCAVVAVATGEGIRRIFRSLHVHHVVTGGQTMNPSTADLLAAVEGVPADHVILLPNNKNIIAVAEQVAALSSKTVRVVPTTGVGEGFAALLEYDPEATADENATAMTAGAERITAGEVTRAVRASDSAAGAIAEGDWLGLSRRGIEVVDAGLAACVTGLIARLITEDDEIVTLIEGDGSSAADTRRVTQWMEDHHPGVEVEIHHGGQPLFPYLVSIE